MTTQRLYDLLVDVDCRASDRELDHCAFLLESFAGIDWLREIIQEDLPRLARSMDPPQSPITNEQALMRCLQYVGKEGYSSRFAQALFEDKARSLKEGNAARIKRKTLPATQPVDAPPCKSAGQRLYELITAADVVDTDFHVAQIAEMLALFGSTLDAKTLVQDAPRIQLAYNALASRTKMLALVHTTKDTAEYGLKSLDILIDLYTGVVQHVASLLKELVEGAVQNGASRDEAMEERKSTRIFTQSLAVERIPSNTFSCSYVWMIEDNSHNGAYGAIELKSSLADSAKTSDRELVGNVVSPLLTKSKGERLLKFVVCVAGNRAEAKRLAEQYANEWQLFTRGHLLQQLDVRDARHVVLLPGNERPRAIFVWGKENHWQAPRSSFHFRL